MFVKISLVQTIKTIGVCGAGTMGSGIAQVSAMAGFSTILFDLNKTILDKGKSGIELSLDKLTAKNKISEIEKAQIVQRIIYTDDIKECRADLIIEAIIENETAKVELFNQLAAINSNETILATNTSSISVSSIANKISGSHRFAGMHFFNPAPLMKLVELIKADETDDATINTMTDVLVKMGKTAVICKDAPGFIVNRVARQYYLEAMHLVEAGLADIRTVDAAMEAAGFKMGPFKLMDLIGMDINFAVSNIVWEALGKPLRLQPSGLQKQKVAEGNLGKKTGKGFYQY